MVMAHLIGMYAVGRVNHAGAVVGLHLLEDGVLRIVVNAAAGVVVGERLNHLGARAALRAREVVCRVMTVVRLQLGEGAGVRVLMSGGSLARDGCRMVVIVVSLEGRPRTDRLSRRETQDRSKKGSWSVCRVGRRSAALHRRWKPEPPRGRRRDGHG
jgi:hypothetical protein